MKKLYEGFCRAEEALCNVGFMAMILLVFCSAIARGMGTPLAWSIDVAQLLLCWTTLIGADIAFRHGKFLGLDLFTRHLPDKLQKLLPIAVDLMIECALLIFIFWGTRLSVESYKRSFQTLKVSYSLVTIALPVMSVLMTISVCVDLKKRFRELNSSDGESRQTGGDL